MKAILAAAFMSVFVVIPCHAQEKTILKNESQSPILAWRKQGIDCLLDNRGEAMELRFNKEFRGVTQAGIGYGMRQKTARQAYGEPEFAVNKNGGEKWEWRSKGILIWFNRGRVIQIVIFRPQ